jgi:ABC-2 type transport system permease protein
VWDQDHGYAARQLVQQLTSAGGKEGTFELRGYIKHPDEIQPLLARGDVRFVLVIPNRFGRDVGAGRFARVQALIDAADSNTAGVAAGYLGAAVGAYNAKLTTTGVARQHGRHSTAHDTGAFLGGGNSVTDPLDLRWRVLYNPDLSSRRFIVPGLIAVLLSILAATLTSTTITRERELGSLESLLTSPVGAADLVFGKMAPYLVVAFINVGVVLLVGLVAFHLWPRGSVLTLAAFTLLFLPGMLALGMIISAVAPSQQVALVLATLTGFLPTLFLTGFAFPRSNMGWLVQQLSWPLPATQFIIATRALYLKGTGWDILWPQAVWLIVSGSVLVAVAIVAARANLARGLG